MIVARVPVPTFSGIKQAFNVQALASAAEQLNRLEAKRQAKRTAKTTITHGIVEAGTIRYITTVAGI